MARSFQRHLEQDTVRITHDLRLPPVDVVVLFVSRVAELERRFADIAPRLHPAGAFWVAFKTCRGSDITEEVVRRIALAAGMLSTKVCVIETGWSGVRLVLRDEIRDAMMYRVAPPPPISRRVRRPTAPARIVRASGAGSTLRRVRARSTK